MPNADYTWPARLDAKSAWVQYELCVENATRKALPSGYFVKRQFNIGDTKTCRPDIVVFKKQQQNNDTANIAAVIDAKHYDGGDHLGRPLRREDIEKLLRDRYAAEKRNKNCEGNPMVIAIMAIVPETKVSFEILQLAQNYGIKFVRLPQYLIGGEYEQVYKKIALLINYQLKHFAGNTRLGKIYQRGYLRLYNAFSNCWRWLCNEQKL